MRSILIFSFVSIISLFSACKQPSHTDTEVTNENTTEAPGQGSAPDLSQGHDQTFLTHQLFHYNAAVVVGKDPKDNPYAGQWIDLESDGTYKAGTLGNQTHTGRWSYNKDAAVLLLKPDDRAFKMSEWNVKHNNDMVILIGTQTYGNNATQIQLVRRTELPEQG